MLLLYGFSPFLPGRNATVLSPALQISCTSPKCLTAASALWQNATPLKEQGLP